MGYNGLAKDFKKRWGKTPDADEDARDAQSERASVAGGADDGVPQDWNDDAQDQISALLDEVTDDAEDDAIDLAAVRRALVREDADPEDDLYHAIDEVLLPEAPVQSSPATEALDEEAHEARDAETTTPASSPKAAMIEPLFKDPVVTEMLEQGTVTLPQALTEIRRQAEQPEQDLWRILAELPNVDRMLVYEQAATLLGFETIDIGENFSAELIQPIVEWLPPPLRDNLFTFNLLPLKLKTDPETRQHSLLLVTSDPSHPDLQPLLEGLGMPVELYFAPEDVVTLHLEQVMALLGEHDASDEEPASHADAEAAAVELNLASDDPASLKEIVDLTEEDDDVLELQWEPFAEEEPAADEAAEVEWKSLDALMPADADAPPQQPASVAFDFTPEELARLVTGFIS
ncbi:MAG: hypothetical protein IH820_17825 [Bacteroidetes bacterium]|nr:hypothetical protein [Bacteroidota bacterium]